MFECSDKMCEALHSDLHRSRDEGWLTEINPVQHHIQMCLDHLDEWMAPEPVMIDVVNIPGYSYVEAEPLGVALVIGAWNYPIQLTLMPIVGAIAAGNTVCVKVPSSKYSSASSRALADCLHQYLDPEAVCVIEGDRSATQAVLAEKWDSIFFTGGCFVGRMVAEAAAKNLTPVVLELGGKSPCIVDRTADLAITCRRIVWGGFFNAGQTCVRPDYVLVEDAVADVFLAEMIKTVKKFYGDKPSESEFFGRLINTRAAERVQGLLKKGDGKVIVGGENNVAERYCAPTVVDFGSNVEEFEKSGLMNEELFAPILPVLRYKGGIDQVVEFINAREKPLVLYAFTDDATTQSRLKNETSSGATVFNDTLMHMASHKLPFGGVGNSGMGRYHGKYSFDTFSHQKPVLVKYFALDWLVQRYPPYSALDVKILRLVQYPRNGWKNELLVSLPKIFVFILAFYVLWKPTGFLKLFFQFVADLL